MPLLAPLGIYLLGGDGTAASWTGSYPSASLIAAIKAAVAAGATPAP